MNAGVRLFIVSAALALSTASAQTDLPAPTSGTDSAKALNELRARRRALLGTRDSLEDLRDDLRANDDTVSLASIDRSIDSLDTEIAMLGDRIGDDEYADEDFWDMDWKRVGSDDEGDDRQFRWRMHLFDRHAAGYPLPFPLHTALGETVFRYNRVEGVYIGMAQPKKQYWHSRPSLVGTGSLGYGFASHRWRYGIGLYAPVYFGDQIVEIGGEGHSYTDSKDQWTIHRDENTAMAFFAREDFMDYFGREGFSATVSWYYRSGRETNLGASVGYVHDTYESLARGTNWSLFGGDKEFRPSAPINDGNVNSLVATASWKSVPSIAVAPEGWGVQASLEKSGDFLKGDFAFTQIVFDARRYQPLAEFLLLNLRFRAAASDGTLPLQRTVDLGGPSTLPGYRYKEFSGTHGMLANAEIIVRPSFARDARGWVHAAFSGTNLILFADAGVTNDALPVVTHGIGDGALAASMSDGFHFGTWKSDVGVAVGSADGDFRIGAAWRLDRAESPNLVVRFARPF